MSSGTGILVYNIWHLMNGKNTQNTETGRAQKEKLQSEKRKIGLMFLVICFLHFISLSGCPPQSSTIFNGTQNKAKLSAFSSNLTLAHVLCLPPGSSSGVSAVGVVFKMSSHLSPPPTYGSQWYRLQYNTVLICSASVRLSEKSHQREEKNNKIKIKSSQFPQKFTLQYC